MGLGRGRVGRTDASRRADTSQPARAAATPSPGQAGTSATIELDPRRVGRVRFAYAPERDGEPDPGEVVWTWVPFEERDGRGKDRPVAIVAAGAPGEYLAVQLTSKPHDDPDRYVALGAGAWDAEGRPSWARIDRVYRVRTAGMRREGATLDRPPYERLTAALAARHGWR